MRYFIRNKRSQERKFNSRQNLFIFLPYQKKQAYNQELFQSVIKNNITLIDYECMEHEDGQRILGFGFFAGVVGAHNGIMSYGNRTGAYSLQRVYKQKKFQGTHSYLFRPKTSSNKNCYYGFGKSCPRHSWKLWTCWKLLK